MDLILIPDKPLIPKHTNSGHSLKKDRFKTNDS